MGKSLLDVLRDVTLDAGEQAAFASDPAAYLAQYGYQDVQADDLAEAFSLVADTLPPEVAQAVSSGGVGSGLTADADLDTGRGDAGLGDGGQSFGEGFDTAVVAVAPVDDAAGATSFDDPTLDVDDDMGFGAGSDDQFAGSLDDGLGGGGLDAMHDGDTPDFGDAALGLADPVAEADVLDMSESVDDIGTLDEPVDSFDDDTFDDADAPGGLGDSDDIGSF